MDTVELINHGPMKGMKSTFHFSIFYHQSSSSIDVYMGIYRLDNMDAEIYWKTAQRRQSKRVYVNFDAEIALILVPRFESSKYIRSIPLVQQCDTSMSSHPKDTCLSGTIAGSGDKSRKYVKSTWPVDTLSFLEANVRDDYYCIKADNSTVQLPDENRRPAQYDYHYGVLCLQLENVTVVDQGWFISNVCRGDLGAPFFCYDNQINDRVVSGIVAKWHFERSEWNCNMGSHIRITRLCPYLNWINRFLTTYTGVYAAYPELQSGIDCMKETIFSVGYDSPYPESGFLSRVVDHLKGKPVLSTSHCPISVDDGFTVSFFLKVKAPSDATSIVFRLDRQSKNPIELSYRTLPIGIQFTLKCVDVGYFYDEIEKTVSHSIHLPKDMWHFFVAVFDYDKREARIYTGSGVLVVVLGVHSDCQWDWGNKRMWSMEIGEFWNENEEFYCVQFQKEIIDHSKGMEHLLCNCHYGRPCNHTETSVPLSKQESFKFPITDGIIGYWPLLLNEQTGWSLTDLINHHKPVQNEAKTVLSPFLSSSSSSTSSTQLGLEFVTSRETEPADSMVTYLLQDVTLFSHGLTITMFKNSKCQKNQADFFFFLTGIESRDFFTLSLYNSKIGIHRGIAKQFETTKEYEQLANWTDNDDDDSFQFFFLSIDWTKYSIILGIDFNEVETKSDLELLKSLKTPGEDSFLIALRPSCGSSVVGLTMFDRLLSIDEIRLVQNQTGQLLPNQRSIMKTSENNSFINSSSIATIFTFAFISSSFLSWK